MHKALVVGGAGYIGSVTARLLAESGFEVVVYDNLSRGHIEALMGGILLEEGDIRDRSRLLQVLDRHRPDCVLHFAALAYVGESFPEAPLYFDVNVGGTASLLAAMAQTHCRRLVFSSSCTVYGEPDRLPITEEAPVKPAVSPYGQTKQMCETLMDWQSRTAGLSYVALRYFNAAGAWHQLGEDHQPETHLIPLAIDAALGRVPQLAVFGTDYPTPDGTCIRDYIHVRDLADAHVKAARLLMEQPEGSSQVINLGSGRGSSIRDVIDMVEDVAGQPLPVSFQERRPGDPPRLVASIDKACRLLKWEPRFSTLRQVVESAWTWRLDHPNGYSD